MVVAYIACSKEEQPAMARMRTIQPTFPNTYRISEVPREARYLKLLLPLVADDAGRFRVDDYSEILHKLFPGDKDATVCLPGWLADLEHIGMIETYTVKGRNYARLVYWAEEQAICHPTPSLLPPSPTEPPEDSRISRTRRGQKAKGMDGQGHADRSVAILESDFIFSDDGDITMDRKALLRLFGTSLVNAEARGSHTAAIRAAEMLAKYSGIRPADEVASDAPASGSERDWSKVPSPAEAHGLPNTSGKR